MRGLVLRSTGSWYDIKTTDGTIYKGRLRGKMRLDGLRVTNPIAVGDFVQMEMDNEVEQTTVIKKIEKRENYIIRKAVKKRAHGHLIAANIDQVILLVTQTFPKTSLGFIDRFLVTAESFRIPTVLVFNKSD